MVDLNTENQIKEVLRNFWKAQSLDVDGASTSIDDLVAAMDSLTAVDALIEVERIVGMNLPTGNVIRRGGYDNEEQFVEDVTTRVLGYVKEQGK